ncbi:MAG: HAMP domain-containing protein [Thiomicrospira sp.]|uniref:methyl-accepting chemotaxis protein n=1 Tax=Thiomicrospira sp. TaxID=935 RepID=UPI0019F1A3C8|nr:methyl-accepting chemotaxis protein [Thiomicrospira sp.]MBE0493137.1 HAMP domain-containing protein [Thiomicrospira sp.]
MKIKTRLLLSIIAVLVLLTLGNLFTQFIMHQSQQAVDKIINVNSAKLNAVNKLKNFADERAIMQRNMVIIEDEEALAKQMTLLTDSSQNIAGLFDALDAMELDKAEAIMLGRLRANAASAFSSFGGFTVALDVGFTDEAKDILLNDFDPKYQEFAQIVDVFLRYEMQQNVNAVNAMHKDQQFNQMLIWSGLGISALLLIFGGLWVASSITKPLEHMANTMQKVVQTGDLTHRANLKCKGEMGMIAQGMDQLMANIESAIKEVNQVMQTVAKGQFSARVSNQYEGHFLELKNGVNQSVNQVEAVMNMLQKTAHNFRSGELNVHRDQHAQLQGGFEDVLFDLERSASHIKESVDDIGQTLNALEHGDFSKRVEAEARGDFVPLKDSINKSLDSLEQFVESLGQVQNQISQGDLSARITQSYEGKMQWLRDNLNQSTQNMAEMIGQVGLVTHGVSSGARSMANGSQDLSDRIQQLAQSLEKTSSSMEEMTGSVKRNAENADQANKMSTEAQQKLTQGVSIMQQAMGSMEDMLAASRKIEDIITLIDGIAFQTNLLALNAAVEAARAGDHGRGFAVVAGEVRGLAGKSAEAAGQIKGLIEDTLRISETSGDLVRQTSEALTEINQSMATMSSMVSDIANASQQQADGINTVSHAVSEMDSVTQQNAAIVEELAAGSHDLQEQADDLRQQVSRFRLEPSANVAITKKQS